MATVETTPQSGLNETPRGWICSMTELRRVAAEIAVAAGIEAQKAGVAPQLSEDELRQRVLKTQWTPAYTFLTNHRRTVHELQF